MTKNIFKLLFAAAFLVTVLVLEASAQARDLGSKQWTLTNLNGSAVQESNALIEIDATMGRFNGNAGCNRMFGSAKVSGKKDITFSGIGTTKMMCADQGVAKLESEFVAALGKVTKYKVSGNVLTMYTSGHRTIQYKALSKQIDGTGTAAKLEDKKWVLEWIGAKPGGALGSQAFISFFPDRGSAGGNTSCNAYGGNYVVKGKFLTVKQVISTMRACIEDDRMQIERSFLDGLQRTDRYEIRGGKLYLYHGAELLLSFRGEDKSR